MQEAKEEANLEANRYIAVAATYYENEAKVATSYGGSEVRSEMAPNRALELQRV